MENIIFRTYRSSDREQIYKLWKQEFELCHIEKRKFIFSWLVEENPYLMGEPPAYHIAECNGEIIGCYGKMPINFSVNGEIIEGYFSHDILVHLKYWGKGIADRLVMELKTKSKTFVAALWFNQPNYRLHTKSRWLEVKGCYSYRKIYNIEGFLKKKLTNRSIIRCLIPIIKYGLRVYTYLLSVGSNRTYNKEVNPSFDRRFDVFAKRISKFYGIMVFRDAKYLTWKYLRRPYVSHKIIVATQNEEIIGYITFRVRETERMREGVILDVICEPSGSEVFKFLITEAEKSLREDKVDYITCLVTYPPFQRALRKCGFIRSQYMEPVMVTNFENYFSKAYVERIENWYLTLGDSDGDAWEVK